MTDLSSPLPQSAGPPMRPAGRYQGIFWFALLAATAVALGGASLAVGAYESAGDPETVVRAYFGALSDGDAGAALGYGDVPGSRHDLLTSEMLAAQNAVAPIEDLTILATHRDGGSAVVDVDYSLALPAGRTTVQDAVPVTRKGHDWRLAQSAVAVSIDPGVGSTLASFAGAAIPKGDYAMFPGAVPVAYSTPVLEPDPSSRVIRFAGDSRLQLDAQVSRLGRTLIVPRVRDALVACLAGKGNPQPLCPVPNVDQAVPGSLRGTATAEPSDSVQLIVDSANGKIDITDEASVKATYQELDKNNIASPADVTSVGVHAHCFATVPQTIIWDTP